MAKHIPSYKIADFTPAKSHFRNSPKGKRYYIDFYAYDEATDRKKRKVIYCPKAIAANKTTRQNWFIENIGAINEMLAEGAYFPAEAETLAKANVEEIVESKTLTVEDALLKVVSLKESTSRHRTGMTYKSAVNVFLIYARAKGFDLAPVSTLTQKEMLGYLDYVSVKKKLSNRTRNNYLLFLRALFNHLKERRLIVINPCDGLKSLETESASHQVYSAEDRETLEAYLKANRPRLFYFTRFMYYCFIRRKELHYLQIKHIQLAERKIIIPANIAKTKKQAAVFISEPMAAIIDEMNLPDKPEWYLFSKEFKPGPHVWHINRSTEAHRRALEAVKLYGKGYDLYSWKHTGNVNAYKSGVDIIALQTQNRHTKLETTRTYLKELGLIENSGMKGKTW